MEISAQAKFIRMSPKKIRLVANLIKGLSVDRALTELEFAGKKATLPLIKLLKSAICNAQENEQLDRNNLLIKEIRVNEGPTLKRWLPQARGRATILRKRMAHIILVLTEKTPTVKKEKAGKEKAIKKTDDIIKIDDFNQIKEKEKKSEKEKVDFKKAGGREQQPKGKTNKNFVGRIFSRKSGEK